MKKKLDNKYLNEVLVRLKEQYFSSYSFFDNETLIKRNGPLLMCITLYVGRDRLSFEIVRHVHFLVADNDFIALNLVYRAINRRGRIPRIYSFSRHSTIEDMMERFDEDINQFSIAMGDSLKLGDLRRDFDEYFQNDLRCVARFHAKLIFDWLLTLSTVMNDAEFESILQSELDKLQSWNETCFRPDGFNGWKKSLTELLENPSLIDKRIQRSIDLFDIGDLQDFKLDGNG